jgi:hypothetical protein
MMHISLRRGFKPPLLLAGARPGTRAEKLYHSRPKFVKTKIIGKMHKLFYPDLWILPIEIAVPVC